MGRRLRELTGMALSLFLSAMAAYMAFVHALTDFMMRNYGDGPDVLVRVNFWLAAIISVAAFLVGLVFLWRLVAAWRQTG